MDDNTVENLEPALYVVATPIGNLGDLSPRARSVLIAVDAVYAEDTRHSQSMFRQLGMSVRARSLHQHNERSRIDDILACVRGGGSVALISDAGTPLISDPGARVVDAMHTHALAVRAVPGPSAVTTALSVCGIGADSFRFQGFLPAKAGARDRSLAELARVQDTLVLFEAPHRLLASLRAMGQHFGPTRRITLLREMTKRYETVVRKQLADLIEWVERDENQQRGEIVLVVEGNSGAPARDETVSREALVDALVAELPPRQAAKVAARLLGGEKNRWYQDILNLKR
ncbi:MAG: 16S rRNA (cytidine(1402)-2'-O)-methyltransferase [Pseudomonadota bacterium]